MRVTVTRTGGFAGLRREWSAESAPEDAARWVALIDDCPWDAVAPAPQPPQGADLFVWRISARCSAEEATVDRDAELQEPQVQGAWHELISAVREAAAARDASEGASVPPPQS